MATQERLSNFERFLEEQRLRGIVYDLSFPGSRVLQVTPPIARPPPVKTLTPRPIPDPQCLICCKTLPKKEDPLYSKEAVKPCRSCNNDYCVDCVKRAFIDACKDSTRMPPRCCRPFNLHIARPFLTEEEVDLFKQKYEEWSTPNPFYCPVPVCSAFISERLLPQNGRSKDKQRVDSGIGTPTAEAFACPTCEASICVGCRQVAHPGSICDMNDFGLDADTAALLKGWGYKRCPRCSHGVKRMFGCNHMECRCGHHFCWMCLDSIQECDGGCTDGEDDDYDDYDGPDEDEQVEATPTAGDQAADTATAEATTTTAPESSRPRNLDGGTARFWAASDFDFGAEPTNDNLDPVWACEHRFNPVKIPFATALTSPTTELECVKCWNVVHPEIETPGAKDQNRGKGGPSTTVVGVRRGTVGWHHLANRGRYEPPRGLFRADATIGTAPHLTAALSQSLPTRDASPMDDVQFTERIVDTYGNIITTSPAPATQTRRASLSNSNDKTSKAAKTHSTTSNFFSGHIPPFSLAHECYRCQIVVCETCKTKEITAQEKKAKAEAEAEQAATERREAEERRRDEERREAEARTLSEELPLMPPEPEPEQQAEAQIEVPELEHMCSIGYD
ncbi:hypothetical protein EK21DRAFT_65123 [Setomelanomma holmii]|uniref:RBR-type E3 ubiquitin transferase n=1 Tax=Setomelanomma holmii TaxID=210430 RepID=A0A9P4H965_9PLEO|nr:hypothetical protein EK21DRAFT_65123 [Setomelanomma holmii]